MKKLMLTMIAPVAFSACTTPQPAPVMGKLQIVEQNKIVSASSSTTFSATLNGKVFSDVIWSVATKNSGAFTGNTFVAPNAAGEYTITAHSSQNPSLQASTRVRVPVGISTTGLIAAIDPPVVKLVRGGTSRLTLQVMTTKPIGNQLPTIRGLPDGVTARVERIETQASLKAQSDPLCEVAVKRPASYYYAVWLSQTQQPLPENDDETFEIEFEGGQLPAFPRTCSLENTPGGCPDFGKRSSQKGKVQTLSFNSQPLAYQEVPMQSGGDFEQTGMAINDLNHVAVLQTGANFSSAGLWKDNQTMIGLGIPGVTHVATTDLNNQDVVVGYAGNSRLEAMQWQTKGVTAGKNAPATKLGVLEANGWSVAHAINDNGTVVGAASTTTRQNGVPVTFQAGTAVALHPVFEGFQPDVRAEAIDVNSNGQILIKATRGNACATSYLWDNGILREVGNPQIATFAAALNDAGQVVGDQLINQFWQGFTWQNGQLTLLDVPDQESHAAHINNAGQIIGSMGYLDSNVDLLIENGTARATNMNGANVHHRNKRINQLGTVMLGNSLYFPSK